MKHVYNDTGEDTILILAQVREILRNEGLEALRHSLKSAKEEAIFDLFEDNYLRSRKIIYIN